ncbi:MAG: ATP-binding protein [Thermodesulfovibrio sp.]|nr:ATP-binding protein [Thermodesulfovibrio sp.]
MISLNLETENLSEILNNLDDNLSILDEECNIIWANKAYYNRLGKKYDEILGKKCYSLWHHLTSPCHDCPCVKSFKTGNTEIAEKVTPEGRHFILVGIPLKTNDGRKLVFEIGREITEKKLSREKVVEILQIKAFNNLLGDFCHHLNNIFTGIYGFAQILGKYIQGEKSENYLGKLINSIERGIQFLKNIEKLKPVSNTNKVFDLNYLIISMKNTLYDIVSQKNIKLNISTSNLKSLIRGDPFQLRELIFELVKNAKDSILDSGTIDIKIEKIDSKVVLIVKDSGIGMNEKILKRCLDPFFTTYPRKFGLGLTISKSIAERMNGSLKIESHPNSGTIIKVYFPEAILPQEQDT